MRAATLAGQKPEPEAGRVVWEALKNWHPCLKMPGRHQRFCVGKSQEGLAYNAGAAAAAAAGPRPPHIMLT